MSRTSGQLDSADLFQRLEQLNRIGVALSRERDILRLLEAILIAAKDITNADGGTLYRMTEERKLKFEIMRNDSLGIAMGGTSGAAIPFYPVHLYDKQGQPIESMVVAYCYHHDTSVNIADAYSEQGFDFNGTKSFDKKTGYRSCSFLAARARPPPPAPTTAGPPPRSAAAPSGPVPSPSSRPWSLRRWGRWRLQRLPRTRERHLLREPTRPSRTPCSS